MTNSNRQNELGQFIPLHYHFQMLADSFRMAAFKAAIERSVKAEDKVLDLGSGTGVMAYRAAGLGAAVTGVEYNDALVEASRKFLLENDVVGSVEIIKEDASTYTPGNPYDVVICEMLHSGLLREKQVEVIAGFRSRHFEKFGRIPQFIPAASLLAVQPVKQNYVFDGYYAPVPFFQDPYADVTGTEFTLEPKKYATIDYSKVDYERIYGEVSYKIKAKIQVNAVRLVTKNLLYMNHISGETIDWHNQYLIVPLKKEVVLNAGQTLQISLDYMPGDSLESFAKGLSVQII